MRGRPRRVVVSHTPNHGCCWSVGQFSEQRRGTRVIGEEFLVKTLFIGRVWNNARCHRANQCGICVWEYIFFYIGKISNIIKVTPNRNRGRHCSGDIFGCIEKPWLRFHIRTLAKLPHKRIWLQMWLCDIQVNGNKVRNRSKLQLIWRKIIIFRI